MKRIYIGSLELYLELGEKEDSFRWDEQFLSPVLPTTVKRRVNLYMDKFRIPLSCEEYHSGRMQVHVQGKEEWRSYFWADEKEKEQEIATHRSEHGEVEVYMRNIPTEKLLLPWNYIHLEELLLENQALILHSASIIYKDHAVLFTAPSGTGKTTQTDLWHRYLEDVEDLNGDRTLLQCTPNGWYACGFPICGSSGRCEQKAAPIRAVVILRQGAEDKIYELSPAQKTALLYSEVTVPHFQRTYIEKAMGLLEDFIREIPVFLYSCTMQESAVTTLHHYLYGGTEDGII